MQGSLDGVPRIFSGATMPVTERISKRERTEKPKKRKKKAKLSRKPVSAPPASAENGDSGPKNFPLAAACLNLPSRSKVLALDGGAQRACFKLLGDTTHRIIRLLGDVQSAARNSTFEHDEDAMVADMAKLRASVPMARHFVEHSLWKRVKRFSDDEMKSAGGTGAGEKKKVEIQIEREFRNRFTGQHGEELDGIREREQLDEGGVKKLLKCVDEAAALYTAVLIEANIKGSPSL